MSWTYNPANLDTSKRDQVRFKLGDTVEADGLLQDEEIDFLLEQANGNVLNACIQGCVSIITFLSGFVDFKIGPYSESQGSRLNAYQVLYRQLLAQAARMNPPLAEAPTTAPVFHYDMMSLEGPEHE